MHKGLTDGYSTPFLIIVLLIHLHNSVFNPYTLTGFSLFPDNFRDRLLLYYSLNQKFISIFVKREEQIEETKHLLACKHPNTGWKHLSTE